MWDLVGTPEDRFSQNEAQMYIFSNIGFEGRILNLIVQVSSHCLSFTFSFLFFECFTLEDHMLDKCQLNMLSLINKDFFIFYLLSLQLVLCRVAALKSGPVHRP